MNVERVLEDAHAAEREGRYVESFQLCRSVLLVEPDDPDATNLLGRLCFLGGDLVAAIALQRQVLRTTPDHARATADLTTALAAVPSVEEAERAYARALEIAPDLAIHHRAPPARTSFDGIGMARAELERAVASDPAHAKAHAALGNLLAREDRFVHAITAYQRAVLLDPRFAEADLGLAELLHIVRDDESATSHRRRALQYRSLFRDQTAPSEAVHVLMLVRDAPYSANVPLDLVVDPGHVALHRLYLPTDDGALDVGRHDVVFNAIGYAEGAESAIEAATAFFAATDRPRINDPSRLRGLARTALATTLRDVEQCIVPETIRVEREALHRMLHERDGSLVRPVDTHAGRGFERLTVEHVDAYLARWPHAAFYVSTFVEYASPDAYYRKYRVVLVDGVAYPYHLAISPSWMVHHQTAPMKEHAWMRAEEARFVANPHAAMPFWDATFPAIARTLGLDYVGIDCGIAWDGRLIVFEADTAMLVHDEEPDGLFAYKRAAFREITCAVERMIRSEIPPL